MSPAELVALFEDALQRLSLERYRGDDGVLPATRYALAGTGKRVRPVLCLLSASAVGGDPRAALTPALAVEMVHTYSLVHDDLPCMDDDDVRRGRPTTHVAYDEALALLAGDALLTDAFALLAEAPHAAALVRELAAAAGGGGMVQGQALDLYWTSRPGAGRAELDRIHRLKTGGLIGAACSLGGIAAGAGVDQIDALREFGRRLGLAFQIQDDLLDDHTGTGKSTGKDKQAGKLTYPSLLGRQQAAAAAREATDAAQAALAALDARAEPLRRFALGLLERQR